MEDALRGIRQDDVRRRWRDYRNRSGARPVKAFLDELTDEEVAAVVAGNHSVRAMALTP
jgi:hypothetical protein